MKLLLALVVVCLCARTPALAENILVLPFFNLSGDSNLEWIGESLSETIREALASEGVIAVSRDDRQEGYRRLSLRPNTQLTRATVLRLGEFLDADQVIYGQFTFAPPEGDQQRVKGTLRISAQVLDLKKASRGPAWTEIGSLEDLARLQTHLAWQAMHHTTKKTAVTEEEFRSKRPAIRVEAIENHVRGLLAPAPEQKLKLFTQAVRLDPRYSQASFELGRLYWERKNYRMAADQLKSVAAWDIRYREANFLLGLCRYHLREFAAAEQAFRSVVESVPLNEVWNNLAAAQSRLNSPEALANFTRALEGDPADPDYHFNVGYALLRQGDFEAAAERFRAVLERNPADAEATSMLGRALRPDPGQKSPIARSEGVERLKLNYEESAWLQLKAVLNPER
jgi:tetratricopeptide (TPR) repeat protein